MPKYYAVAKGKQTGIYNSWDECRKQVNGYSGSKFKSFKSAEEAQKFIDDYKNSSHNSSHTSRSHPYDPNLYRPKSLSSNRYPSGRSNGSDQLEPFSSVPVVYTDGACSRNGFNGAKGGIGVFWGDGHEDNLSEPLDGRQTNNRAEIKAAQRAIEQAKQRGYSEVTVRTDSNFLYQSVTAWIDKWKRNGWKKSDGSDVINKEDFEELDEAMRNIKVNFEKVAAHRGIHGNEEADRLANEGMNRR